MIKKKTDVERATIAQKSEINDERIAIARRK